LQLYCYIVARDFGFAPNPFHGYCTLATCKPVIRRCAHVGDWVVGMGSVAYALAGHLVFAMQVTEILSYDQYWDDPRFQVKKPNLYASRKFAFGDNVYHRNLDAEWLQSDSHHSFIGGAPNPVNVRKDTSAPRVLVSTRFAYWGRSGPLSPNALHDAAGNELCVGRNHRTVTSHDGIESFITWFESRGETGYLGDPAEWNTYVMGSRQLPLPFTIT
jgi:hypothetical protein